MPATLNWSAKSWKDFPSSSNEENFLAALAKLKSQTKNLYTSTYLECIKVGQSRMNRATPNNPAGKAHRMFWWLVNMDAPTTVQDKSMQDSRRILEQTSPCYYDPIGRTQWYCHMLKLLDKHRYGHSNHVKEDPMYITALRPWLTPPFPSIPFPDLDKAPAWVKHYGNLVQGTASFSSKDLLHEVAQLPIENQFEIVRAMSTRDVSPAYTQMQVDLFQHIAGHFQKHLKTEYPNFDYGGVASTLLQNPAVDKETIVAVAMDLIAAWDHHNDLPAYLKLTSTCYDSEDPIHALFTQMPRAEQLRIASNAITYLVDPTHGHVNDRTLDMGRHYVQALQPWPDVYVEQLQRIIPHTARGLAFAQALDPQAAIAETLCGPDWHAHWKGLYQNKGTDAFTPLPSDLDEPN